MHTQEFQLLPTRIAALAVVLTVSFSCTTGQGRLRALRDLGPEGRTNPTRVVVFCAPANNQEAASTFSDIAQSRTTNPDGILVSSLTDLQRHLLCYKPKPPQTRGAPPTEPPGTELAPAFQDQFPTLYHALLHYCENADSTTAIKACQYEYDTFDGGILWLTDYYIDGTCLGTTFIPYGDDAPLEQSWTDQDECQALGWSWHNYLAFPFDLAVSLAVGTKELGFEILKAPLSLLEWTVVATARRDDWTSPLKAAGGDIENGLAAFTWRFRSDRPPTVPDLLRDAVGAIPVVGPGLSALSPPDRTGSLPNSKLIAISNGIFTKDGHSAAACWRINTEDTTGIRTVTTPYNYGGICDVGFSVLNLSNGFGYELAEQLTHHGIKACDVVSLAAFSGGVQRSVAASRVLRQAGVATDRFVGVAGPCLQPSVGGQEAVLLTNDGKDFVVQVANSLDWVFPTGLSRSAAFADIPNGGPHHIPYHGHARTGPYEDALVEFWARH